MIQHLSTRRRRPAINSGHSVSTGTLLFAVTAGLLPAEVKLAHAAAKGFIARHWPELLFAVVGALLPAIARICWLLIRFVRVRVKPARHPETGLLGTWFAYHFSRRDNRPLLRSERWQMKLNWRGEIAVTTSDDEMPKLIYKGTLEGIDSVNLLCRLHATLHHEELFIRIIYPIPSGHEATFGLNVGENFDHHVYSTLYLFSRDELSSRSAATRLHRKLHQSTEPGLNGMVLHDGASAGAEPTSAPAH